MKVSGFTFLRNAQKLGYPFAQSIRSILPIVDEFVIALPQTGIAQAMQVVQKLRQAFGAVDFSHAITHLEHQPTLSVGVVERSNGAHLSGALKPGQRLVSREGDLWRWDGFAAVGAGCST